MSRRSVDLTDVRSVLRTTGDIAIGAYSRRQQRRRVWVAVSGAALILGAIGAHWLIHPGRASSAANTHPVLVKCVLPECGDLRVVQMTLGAGNYPLRCPKCGKPSCQKVWECRECGLQFLPRGTATSLRCERCGSAQVGTAEALGAEPPAAKE